MSDATNSSHVLDLQSASVSEVNRRLRELESNSVEWTIVGADGQHGVATGVNRNLAIHVNGSTGDCFGMLNAEAELQLSGNAGVACGHSMTGGSVLVRGHVGHSLAAFAMGGFICVYGSAKDGCGIGLDGADVFVRQSVGARAAWGMRAGNIILGSDAGSDVGLNCTGGSIFIRGEPVSMADHMRQDRMREADSVRLGLLLVRAGIKGTAREFRLYRPRNSGHSTNA